MKSKYSHIFTPLDIHNGLLVEAAGVPLEAVEREYPLNIGCHLDG